MTKATSAKNVAGKKDSVIVVLLRQPRMERPTEMRSDPFWEFGSFGLTGCHQRNLLHPKNVDLVTGSRLAFVQGGEKGGFRLVYLTEPVVAHPYADRSEVRWKTGRMPFRYSDAPVVVGIDGSSDMPAIIEMVTTVKRNGWMGKFASRFRSRCSPLPAHIAKQFIAANDARLKKGKSILARNYVEALPVAPPLVDRKRRTTYRGLLEKARSSPA